MIDNNAYRKRNDSVVNESLSGTENNPLENRREKKYHQQEQGGRCGLCGDPYDGPLENEAGGKYATDAIAKCLAPSETTLDVSVQLTANHLGYFEFKLCENNDYKKKFTQDCLDKHPLKVSGNESTKYYPGAKVGLHNLTLEIPAGLTCDQCVLQWRYHTGNSWGVGEDGKGCIGCGPQEEFYACSDIRISNDCSSSHHKVSTQHPTTIKPTTKLTTTTTPKTTTTTVTTKPTTERSTTKPTTASVTTMKPTTVPTTKQPTIKPSTTSTSSPTITTVKITTKTSTKMPTSTTSTTTSTSQPTTGKTTTTTTTMKITEKETTTSLKPTNSNSSFISNNSTEQQKTTVVLNSSKATTLLSKIITPSTTSTSGTEKSTTTATTTTRSTTKQTETAKPTDGYQGKLPRVCVATGGYKNDTNVTNWCMENCNVGFCPRTHCKCQDSVEEKWQILSCRGYGEYAQVPGIDKWCQTNCLSSSGCPLTHCICEQKYISISHQNGLI
ncbi:hypothetical protein KUTeg_004945 [Tegillarca granosa]|uniref:Chitin-binding type-4 domain-containing protein n=1 Tax=Tegillarca granosa TaxID=220873 RepID=A0ABQ9FK59_TEGGR|nr:hypothetical protein KUTeg_004945 [Tegillarca granosa]